MFGLFSLLLEIFCNSVVFVLFWLYMLLNCFCMVFVCSLTVGLLVVWFLLLC